GGDTLIGGGGFDWADYSGGTTAVTVNLLSGGVGGEAQGDTYSQIEGVIGTNFNDVLTGNTGRNFLRGGAGADSLNGGAGADWADYAGAATGVTANLATQVGTGDALGDTYT